MSPRRERSTRPIKITPGDIDILRHVSRFRFLRTQHLVSLTGRSRQVIQRRLQHLSHPDHDVLERMHEPIQRPEIWQPGSKQQIVALSNGGADVLTDLDELERGRFDWRQKNRQVQDRNILHALAHADIVVPMIVAAREREDVTFIDRDTLLAEAPEKTRNDKNPHIWRVTVPDNRRELRLSATPDDFCALSVAWRPEGRNRRHLVIEADRATMPTERSTLTTQSSIVKKFAVYGEAYRTRLHRERYGLMSFRVAVATTSEARARNMLDVAEKLSRERGYDARLYYVTHFGAISTETIFEPIFLAWRQGKVDRVTLFD